MRPPSGLFKACLQEIQGILNSPLQSYKFEAQAELLDGNVIINEVDYRKVIELVLRSLTARDIRLVLKEQHVGSFGEMVQMLEKTPWDFICLKALNFISKLQQPRANFIMKERSKT